MKIALACRTERSFEGFKWTRRELLRGAALLGLALVASPVFADQEQARHEGWMRVALTYGQRNPKAPFAAVVVDLATQREVAWGVNHTVDGPIWHGEMDALQACPRREDRFTFDGLAMYCTGEPCAMCQSAILWAGLSLVVYGSSLPNLVAMGWDGIDLRAEEVTARTKFAQCRVVGGVLASECDETFRVALQLRKAG